MAFTMMNGYLLVNFLPLFIINAFIILKEMTMNQLAWSDEADFKEGQMFGISIDMVHWILPLFGLNEDWHYYYKNLWKYGRKYL